MKTKVTNNIDEEAPDNMPKEIAFPFVYIRAKASSYLTKGPKEYRKDDYFHMPKKRDKKTLALIKSGAEQIVEWKGWNKENPLTKIGIDGFYRLMETFHFTLVSQKTVPIKNDDSKIYRILDEMTMKHVMFGEKTIVLYNLVESK